MFWRKGGQEAGEAVKPSVLRLLTVVDDPETECGEDAEGAGGWETQRAKGAECGSREKA